MRPGALRKGLPRNDPLRHQRECGGAHQIGGAKGYSIDIIEARDVSHPEQRRSAHGEEIIVDADMLMCQQLLQYGGQLGFQWGFGPLQIRRGGRRLCFHHKDASIDLSIRKSGNGLHDADGIRHHVMR
jgi:hypothetical protein